MRDATNRTTIIEDRFATAYDSVYLKWAEVVVGTGAVSISSGELKLNTPANNDVAGLVTGPIYLRNARISVAVDVTNAPARSGIVIAQTKVTTTNPEAENNSLRISLDQVNDKVLVIQDVASTEKTLYNGNWTDGDGTLRLDIEPDGVFRVYEDATVKFTGTLPFTDATTKDIFTHYLYLYAIGLTGTLGYALLDNFQLDLDQHPTDEATGSGVRRAADMTRTPVIGRLLDLAGTQDTFETDHAITDTPTQRVILSRDVRRFVLEEIRLYTNVTNAVTSQFLLFQAAAADDDESAGLNLIYATAAALADAAMYRGAPGSHLATGAAVQANDTVLPVTFDNLERPGQVFFNQDYSGAPGDTKGALILIGREID